MKISPKHYVNLLKSVDSDGNGLAQRGPRALAARQLIGLPPGQHMKIHRCLFYTCWTRNEVELIGAETTEENDQVKEAQCRGL